MNLAGQESRLGTYVVSTVGGERVRGACRRLCTPNPPLRPEDLQTLLEQANQALGRLDGLASILPDISLIIYLYVRKEAVLSSQIEGTQSSLSDLLLYESAEAPGVPLEDVAEVSSYLAAMDHSLRRQREGFPLSLRLIREIHEVLLAKAGAARSSQESSGAARTGSEARARGTPCSCRHRRKK